MNVHQARELVKVVGFQHALTLPTEFFHEMQVLQHRFVGLRALVVLFLQDH